MDPKYAAWIAEHVDPNPIGQCSEVTLMMVSAFPELTRVRGHFHDATWGARTHWWLVNPVGEIIDPTAAQFPHGGIGFYEPLREGIYTEPTGKCLNCGDYTYSGSYFCSEVCETETVADLNLYRNGG